MRLCGRAIHRTRESRQQKNLRESGQQKNELKRHGRCKRLLQKIAEMVGSVAAVLCWNTCRNSIPSKCPSSIRGGEKLAAVLCWNTCCNGTQPNFYFLGGGPSIIYKKGGAPSTAISIQPKYLHLLPAVDGHQYSRAPLLSDSPGKHFRS